MTSDMERYKPTINGFARYIVPSADDLRLEGMHRHDAKRHPYDIFGNLKGEKKAVPEWALKILENTARD